VDDLLFAAGAVLPVFMIIALGAGVRRAKILDDAGVGQLSRLAFTTALPVLIFQKISKAQLAEVLSGRAILCFCAAVLLTTALGWALARLLGMKAVRTGTFIMGCYRSNTVIIGLAVLEGAYGEDKVPVAGIIAGTAVLLYNVLAVPVLTLPHHSPKEAGSFGLLARRLATNPLMIALVAGVAWNLTPLEMPEIVDRPLTWLESMSLPLALVAVGASLRLESFRRGLGHILWAAGLKLVLAPAVGLGLLLALGVTDTNTAAVVVCLSAPTAVATYVMVRSMKGDAELASQMVTVSTAISVVTMAGWLLVLRHLAAAPGA